MRAKHWRILVATAMLIGAAPLARAGGARQLHQPGTLTQSGPYEVTRSFSSSGPPVITVDVGPNGHVVIRLCGHELTQLAGTTPVISIASAAVVVIVGPGTLTGGGFAVRSLVPGVEIYIGGVRLTGNSAAGVKADDAKKVVLENNSLDAMGAFALDITNTDNVLTVSLDINGTGSHAANLVGNEHVVADAVRIANVSGTALKLDGTGAANPTANLKNIDVEKVIKALEMEAYDAALIDEFLGSDLSGDFFSLGNSKNILAGGLGVADIAGNVLTLTNTSGSTFERVNAGGIAGYGAFLDEFSSDNFFRDAHFTAPQFDGFFIDAPRNWVDHSSVNESGGCGIHFGPNSQDNLARQTRSKRSAGSCTCAGTPVGNDCDEGANNSFVDQLP